LFPGAAPVETAIPGKDAAAKASEDGIAQPAPGPRLHLHSPAKPSEPSGPAEDSGVEKPRASEDGSDPAKDRVFRPMLEVDRFQWPAVVSRLDTGAGGVLEPLIDALVRGARRGWKVVAMAGCQRGDGCTTAALAASRQLARQGLRVVLADADFQDPRLSKRLGLAPQCGWEEALGGRVPLAEVAIESLFDRLVLLPVCRPPTGA
jgi:Mrp family chromosome partitioning ATPase